MRIAQNQIGEISTPTMKKTGFNGSTTKKPNMASVGPKLLMANKHYASVAKSGGWGFVESP